LITGTIWRFHNKKATLALLLPLLVMNLFSIGYNAWWEQKEDWRGIASYVARSAQKKPGGIVVFIPGYTEIPFSYYFKDYHVTMDTQGFPGDEVLIHPQPKQMDDIAKVLEGRPYVWLVVRYIELADPKWTVKTWLDTHGYVRQKDLVRESISVLTYIRWDLAPKSSPSSSTEPGLNSFLPLIQWGMETEPYQVRPGETLLEIAVRYGTTVQLLMEINDLKNPNELTAGQELLVPVIREGTPYP